MNTYIKKQRRSQLIRTFMIEITLIYLILNIYFTLFRISMIVAWSLQRDKEQD